MTCCAGLFPAPFRVCVLICVYLYVCPYLCPYTCPYIWQVLKDPSAADAYAKDPEVAKAIEKVKQFLKENA